MIEPNELDISYTTSLGNGVVEIRSILFISYIAKPTQPNVHFGHGPCHKYL